MHKYFIIQIRLYKLAVNSGDNLALHHIFTWAVLKIKVKESTKGFIFEYYFFKKNSNNDGFRENFRLFTGLLFAPYLTISKLTQLINISLKDRIWQFGVFLNIFSKSCFC